MKTTVCSLPSAQKYSDSQGKEVEDVKTKRLRN